MNRIVAFFLYSSDAESEGIKKARAHMQSLAQLFSLSEALIHCAGYSVSLVYEGDLSRLMPTQYGSEGLRLIVGPLLEQKKSAHHVFNKKEVLDRYLEIELSAAGLSVCSDYVGSVPCYYSQRNGVVMSSIEPVTVLATDSRLEDIDVSVAYTLYRYSHLLWEKTLYSHILSLPPDHCLTIDDTGLGLRYNNTVTVTESRHGKSLRSVVSEFRELNSSWVKDSFDVPASLQFPLSSGYDSRLILCGLSEHDSLMEQSHCFSFGFRGAIDVEAAQRLSSVLGLPWDLVELRDYLNPEYLQKNDMVFGASLHSHAMCLFEFLEILKANYASGPVVNTSGFMTGVPGGQHLSQLMPKLKKGSVGSVFEGFCQTNDWDHELMPQLQGLLPDLEESIASEYEHAFSLVEGEDWHRLIMMDNWMRQRQFISVHPRSVEWVSPHIAPHMHAQYQQFFFSLSKSHLWDRRVIVSLFRQHYAELAAITSNSQGLKPVSLNPWLQLQYAFGILFKRELKRLSVDVLPSYYENAHLDIDTPMLNAAGEMGAYPLFHLQGEGKIFFHSLFSETAVRGVFDDALLGRNMGQHRLVCLQAIAAAVQRVSES